MSFLDMTHAKIPPEGRQQQAVSSALAGTAKETASKHTLSSEIRQRTKINVSMHYVHQ